MLARAHRLSPLMFVLLLTAIATVAPLSAQERPASAPPAPTADDYARAETIPGARAHVARRRRQRVARMAAR